MKYTSAETSKLLKKLEDDKKLLLDNERDSSVYDCAVSEDPEEVRPKYDFAETQKEISDIDAKIRQIKHAINVFNSTTEIDGWDMTVDEMLVYIPQLTKTKDRLMSMQTRQPKRRNNLTMAKNGVIDYTYTNYDVKDAKAAYSAAAEKLRQAQLALDEVNCSYYFDIDVDI